jgi:hypothetical protein
MKIYDKIVIDMESGEVIEEDSHEYSGEVALCKGGTTVQAPQPTAEEIALQREQLNILQQQQAETEMMKPYVLSGMGLVEEDGTLRYMTEDERLAGMSELEKSQYDIAKQQQERLAKAYAGELDISPALEESLQQQEQQMSEALSQRLGSNWMQTTSGQQAMSEFQKNAELLREEARRGAMSTEGGLLLSNLGYLGNTQGAQTTYAAQYPTRTSGLFQGYGVLQSPYQQQRQMEYQASIANAQNKAQQQSGLMSGLGQFAGSGMSAYGTYAGLAAMSDKNLKENIVQIDSPIDKIKRISGYDFDWKESGEHDVGVIAQELEQVIPEAVIEEDGIKKVYYHKIIPLLVEAVKELAGGQHES